MDKLLRFKGNIVISNLNNNSEAAAFINDMYQIIWNTERELAECMNELFNAHKILMINQLTTEGM